jgi:hypothetical protein
MSSRLCFLEMRAELAALINLDRNGGEPPAYARALDAQSVFRKELGAVRVTHDAGRLGVQIAVLPPGHRRAVDVRTGVTPGAQDTPCVRTTKIES